jgi:hypothetical protein
MYVRPSLEPRGEWPILRFNESESVGYRPSGVAGRTCWLEDDLGDGYMVAYRLVGQAGKAVIAEAASTRGSQGATDPAASGPVTRRWSQKGA